MCKVNRHVQFPQVLDLGPFCSAKCKVCVFVCICFIFLSLVMSRVVTFLQAVSDFLTCVCLGGGGRTDAAPLLSVRYCGTQRHHALGSLHSVR